MIWAPFMFRDEFSMLDCRLEAMADCEVVHILVESPFTHRGIPKPLHYWDSRRSDGRVISVTADFPAGAGPWANEHAQRNAAWPVIDAMADDTDVVLICDVDEIPSPALLEWPGPGVVAVQMRTFLFAVDWEVDSPCPPTCVAATAGYLRWVAAHGAGLAEVRDGRDSYPVLEGGGWHLSWLGGPEKQREKLETASCHQEEIDARPEGMMIRDGTRYRTSQNGGGLAVRPVDVDDSWPEYVAKGRCPKNWYRPREAL